MNKKGWVVSAVIITAIFLIWKWNKAPTSNATLRHCDFQMDDHWSHTFQQKLAVYVKDHYAAESNIDHLIEDIVLQFPIVDTVHVQICDVDTICFQIQGSLPIFLLNDVSVVSAAGVAVDKQDIDESVCAQLPKVTSQQLDNIGSIIAFVTHLPAFIAQRCDIIWHNLFRIQLRPREHSNMVCLAAAQLVPTEKMIKHCYALHEQHMAALPPKKAKKINMEYDVRFKNQIVMRSGGNYDKSVSLAANSY